MNKWIGTHFQSSTKTTREFDLFSREFKQYIKKNLPENAELVNWNKGHFYVSGFIKREDKFVYFSVSDVRFFKDEWYNHVLIRSAKHEKDYSGGQNMLTNLPEFREAIELLFRIIDKKEAV